ncbi:MAG: DUF5686 family protein [Lewinella sp.]
MIKSFTFVPLLCLALLGSKILLGQINQASTAPDSTENTPIHISNKIGPRNLLFSGGVLKYAEGRKSVYSPSVTNTLSANTVEGVVVDFRPSYTNKLGEGKFYYLNPSLRYGFGNRRFGTELFARYFYHPASRSSLEVSGGRYTKQLNEQSTLSQNIYTSYALLSEDNYLKVYEKTYLKLSHISSPVKNLLLTGTLSWSERTPLENLPEYTDGEFTLNAPENVELDNTAFSRHQLTLLSINLSWQANTKYTHKRGRFVTEGESLKLSLDYDQSIPGLFGSDLDYGKIALRVNGGLRMGEFGAGRFELETGDFISDKRSTFVDFNHFNGNQLIINTSRLGDFQLLDYYTYSTRSAYLKAHYEHRWKGIKVREEKDVFQPVVSINYLLTPALDNYLELGVGLDRILGKWRLDTYLSARGLSYERFGIRLGFAFE